MTCVAAYSSPDKEPAIEKTDFENHGYGDLGVYLTIEQRICDLVFPPGVSILDKEDYMKATGILTKEHRAIEYLLAAMEIQAARLQSGSAVRVEFFLDAVVFLRQFVDECHQRKEEDTLLVALIDAGLAKDSGPVTNLLADHAQAQEFTREIEKNARIVIGGGTNSREDLARCAQGYVSLLTHHFRKEEDELFPSAERLIPAGDQAELDAEFERIESGYLETGLHDKYYGLAEKLANEVTG